MPTNFPAPNSNISPLIRFSRWSLLLVGIGYGSFWQSRYTKQELAVKDKKIKEKEIRNKRLADEKARLAAEEMKMFEELAKGTPTK